jgi:lysophospholipase L1-like esterase
MTAEAGRAVRDTSFAISASRVAGLERILEIARAHHVQVSVFVAPEYITAVHANRSRAAVMTFYRNLSAKYGAPFLDFSDDPPISADTSYFRDPEHLNHHGAELFSRQLADSLAQAPPAQAK